MNAGPPAWHVTSGESAAAIEKRIEALTQRWRKTLPHALDHDCPRCLSGGSDGASQHGLPRRQDVSVAELAARLCQQRGGPVQSLGLALEEPRQVLGRRGVEWSQAQVLAD